MITIFNRKLLTSTFEMKKQAEVRDILDANSIDYYIKVMNQDYNFRNCEYKIYVHKKNYPIAKNLV